MNRLQGSRICVFSYQQLHRKTLDTLTALKYSGYTNVCVYAAPLHYRKTYQPTVEHRPELWLQHDYGPSAYKTAVENLGYTCKDISSYLEVDEPESTIFLVCGAGILPREVTQRYRVINAHPGYLPNVRGLDALKWAVIEHQPIGVTTHRIGMYVDAGEILERCMVPIYKNDTFHRVAERQYQLEIQMLVSAIQKIDHVELFTDGENYPVHKRMPKEMEKLIYCKFKEIPPVKQCCFTPLPFWQRCANE